jgi:hypothetical protein
MGTAAGIDGRATEEMTDRLLPGRTDRGNNRCNVIEIREMAGLFGVLVAKEPMSIAATRLSLMASTTIRGRTGIMRTCSPCLNLTCKPSRGSALTSRTDSNELDKFTRLASPQGDS